MEILLVYLKIFLEKLRALLGSPSRQKMLPAPPPAPAPAPAPAYALTDVPVGYSLRLQGTDACAGEPMETGPNVLDDLDTKTPVSQWGDPQSMLMLDRAKKRCDATDGCKFISVGKDGSYSMYDSSNCTDSKKGSSSVTLENLHQFSGGRINPEGELQVPPTPSLPPPLPTVKTLGECDGYMFKVLEPYNKDRQYPGQALSNRQNYCTTMVNRPGIMRECKQRVCTYVTGNPKGTELPGLKPPWKAMDEGYYYNPETGESVWAKPQHVASGDDHFVMRDFCSDTCLNLTGNQLGRRFSKPMADTFGEVSQVPGVEGGNPWLPANDVFNELPTITDEQCLDINTIKEKKYPNYPNSAEIVHFRPTKDNVFNVFGTPEESCGEDPENRRQGIRRAKKYLGLTENQKACRFEYSKTTTACDRECGVRFLKTEARAAGSNSMYRPRELEMEIGEAFDYDVFADLTRAYDSRPTWKIGKKMGVEWGIDTRPGKGEKNQYAEGVTAANYWEKSFGPDAPNGYKIMAEYAKIEHTALGDKTCGIPKSGWYRTAKIPIENDEDINDLLKKWSFGSKAKRKLINENDTESVLIVDGPNSGSLQKVFSKTQKNAEGGPNW